MYGKADQTIMVQTCKLNTQRDNAKAAAPTLIGDAKPEEDIGWCFTLAREIDAVG